jgi:hypothetical protein
MPLMDVTLTTIPDMEWMIAASVRHSRVISNDHKAQCEAEWPGLRFHLPGEREETVTQADYDDWRPHI